MHGEEIAAGPGKAAGEDGCQPILARDGSESPAIPPERLVPVFDSIDRNVAYLHAAIAGMRAALGRICSGLGA